MWRKSERKALYIFFRMKNDSAAGSGGLDIKNVEGTETELFDYGFIDSGKYFDGAQTLTVKLLQPRMRNSRMMRM